MADGHAPTPAYPPRPAPWTGIFRCFQVALDPRKLLVAAVAILVMSFLWWLLSVAFYYPAPSRDAADYSNASILKEYEGRKKPDGSNYTPDDARQIGDVRYAADAEQWRVLDSLAGPGGRLRTMPWYEYRGPNPFLFVTNLLGSPAALWWGMVRDYLAEAAPVLLEPLVKLLLPVSKLISPGVSPLTRFYLFLILLSNVAVWAFAGGVITRLAAVQLANKGPISLGQAVRFVRDRYLSYLGAPLVPLVIIGACVLGLMAYGVLGLIPFVGDLLVLGLGLPVVIIGGAIMAVFLVGLVGYPLMYPTLSAEADQSDTFDALSRSINYVYQAPWSYLWYWLVAVVYGAAVTLFVLFFTSLTVYVGKWAVGLTASTVLTDRKPDYLFIYAPESFGWKEVLTKDSPYAVRGGWVMLTQDGRETANPAEGVRQVFRYVPVDPAENARARGEFWRYNYWGAGIVCFWLTLMFLMMLGFSYSFFWSAATMIYLLMRLKVDEAELDEVVVDEDEPEPPPAPPKLADGTAAPTSLPVISAPPPVPAPPPPLPPIPVSEGPPAHVPPPPATLPFASPPPPAVPDAAPKTTYTTDEPPPRAADVPKKKDDADDDAPLG